MHAQSDKIGFYPNEIRKWSLAKEKEGLKETSSYLERRKEGRRNKIRPSDTFGSADYFNEVLLHL